jgi:hypothetical protein
MNRMWTAVFAIGMLAHSLSAFAGDWPQILGPNRDGAAVGEKLPDTFPASGLAAAWRASMRRRLCRSGSRGRTCRGVSPARRSGKADRLSAEDGRKAVEAGFATAYRSGIDPDQGPRCVPVIAATRWWRTGRQADSTALAWRTAAPQFAAGAGRVEWR